MTTTTKLYIQLKESLITAVERGDYKPNDQLPSQRMLCEQYGMSHMSVRRAIDELINEGVIYAIPGKGTYVALPKHDAEVDPHLSFTQDMVARGMTASSRMLNAQIVAASVALARMLAINVGDPIAWLRRVRLGDDEPMLLQSSYLPYGLCPEFLKQDWKKQSLFAFLRERHRYRLAERDGTAEARLADEEEAGLLGMKLPAAVLVTEQINYLDDGRPIEFVSSIHRSDRYRLRLRDYLRAYGGSRGGLTNPPHFAGLDIPARA